MLSKRMQELAQQKAKLVELEKTILAERAAQLDRLHLDMGYETRADLMKALRALGKGGGKRGRKPGPTAGAKKKKRTRAKVTPELRAAIEASIRAGGKGAAIAKQHGVSLPTVQNIKRAAGLTRTAKGGGA